MFLLKKLFFKFMELGLGLKTCFLLETKNPVFINFKLTNEETRKVEEALPSGFTLDQIRFSDQEVEPHCWVSYNLYEIKYPKTELAHLKKVRCEINTFVTDGMGRKGIFVFSGSPFVSKEIRWDPIGAIADLAERLVLWIYGVGKLLPMNFALTKERLSIRLLTDDHVLDFDLALPRAEKGSVCLSTDYIKYNDISFFNGGKTYDLVNSNSVFTLATFSELSDEQLTSFKVRGPFFDRSPDALFYHLGEISYLVNALNKSPEACFE